MSQIALQVKFESEKNKLTYTINDKGTGFMPGEEELFFDYNKIRESQTDQYLGYGLIIAKSIIESLGGTISASSNGVGQGSTFTFSIDCDISTN